MYLSKDQYYNLTNHHNFVTIDDNWITLKENKYSSSKWKKLLIDLYKNNYTIKYITASTGSKYVYILKDDKAVKIAIKNHPFSTYKTDRCKTSLNKRIKRQMQRNEKFGNISLIVGVNGVSAKDAHWLIKELL